MKKEVQKKKKKTKIKYMKELNIVKEKIKIFAQKYKHIIIIILPFILIDILTRILGYKIHFYGILRLVPTLFTLSYILLGVGISLLLEKKKGKILYIILFIISFALFITNNIYYSMTDTFFDFSLILLADEGSEYFLDAILNCNIWVYISSIIIIITFILGLKYFKGNTKTDLKKIIKVFFLFLIIHTLTPLLLGKANDALNWSTWRNPRNIYINFNDNNKSMRISGIYEYSVRNFYITFIKAKKTTNEEDITFLEEEYSKEEENYQTNYTGKYKDKNLILLQLEGIDNWLITKEDTPTLYKMMNNSINFTNHYSYYNGGGSTFNSEFAVNTGFITPLSYTQNAYTFNKNSFPYSMANLFKNIGYTINAFHMNTGEYYSRTTNYQNWGYDNYYGLIDINDFKDETYRLDRNLILNEKFNELLFNKDPNEKFVDYIITYSGHLPFTNTKGVCKMLYEEDINNLLLENPDNDYPFEEMSELDCIRRQAKETDYMMKLLLQKLEENNLLDNTVIVAFTDHYLYTIEDKTILDTYKETSNNLINKTPFFIWSKDMKQTKVNKVTSQLNILPTTLNLFGIEYSSNNYIGTDALSQNYEGIVFFSDYSWFDGNVYVENGEVINNKYISESSLEEKNYYISYITKKNDLTLKYNYFKHHK